MGGGNSGNPQSTGDGHALRSNLATLSQKYPLSKSGYFGTASPNGDTRIISTANPIAEAKRFFSILSNNASIKWEERPGTFRAKFRDGSHIVLRISSNSDGSPVVSFKLSKDYRGLRNSQKIHFLRRES
jgi:hypothetical protein